MTHAFAPIHQQQQLRADSTLRAKIDEAKIKDAAGNFGKYSLEEVEEIKDGAYNISIQHRGYLYGHLRMFSASKSVLLMYCWFPLFASFIPNLSLLQTKSSKNYIHIELHRERIQNLSLNRNAVTGEQAAEQRLMEQELDLQLRLLKKENKKSSSKLFPDEMVTDLPHLRDDGPIGTAAYQQKSKSDDFYMKELLMEENVIETVAFCSFLAVLMMAPNILQ